MHIKFVHVHVFCVIVVWCTTVKCLPISEEDLLEIENLTEKKYEERIKHLEEKRTSTGLYIECYIL